MTDKELQDILDSEKGLWMRLKALDGCEIAVYLYNPEYKMKAPEDGYAISKLFKKPMNKALKMLGELGQ